MINCHFIKNALKHLKNWSERERLRNLIKRFFKKSPLSGFSCLVKDGFNLFYTDSLR